MQVWKTLKRKPQQLADAPELPEELQYIWEWFREVFAGEPLTYTELQAWSAMSGKRTTGWEAELIKSLDRIFWRVQHGDRRSKSSN